MSTAGEGRFGCIPAIGSECDPAMQMVVEAVDQYVKLRAVTQALASLAVIERPAHPLSRMMMKSSWWYRIKSVTEWNVFHRTFVQALMLYFFVGFASASGFAAIARIG